MTAPKHISPGEDIFDLMGMHILITGNPVDGFEYFGPFFTETLIFKGGEIWLRWHQKHGGELLEVCVRRSEQ